MDYFVIGANLFIAFVSFVLPFMLINNFKDTFIKANLFGIDLNKADKTKKVPEAVGIVVGITYLVSIICFILFPFWKIRELEPVFNYVFALIENQDFYNPNLIPSIMKLKSVIDLMKYLIQYLGALSAINMMMKLGFTDDVLDLRWRHKFSLPTVASLPLLFIYYVLISNTTVIVPKPITFLLGTSLDLGIFYYIYMGMLAVFCTNAINIYAGINGLEVGQSLVICASVIAHNLIEMQISTNVASYHTFSLYFMMPFMGSSLALYYYNKYPSKVFVGDTFCYFAGMTFATVGILGHFSKTMILFFIPQTINFVYSIPQLFRLVHCPRHRLPKYNAETDLLGMSYSEFKTKDLSKLGHLSVNVLEKLALLDVHRDVGEDNQYMRVSNMTLINLVLMKIGPTHEARLTNILIALQVVCSLFAFFVRYYVATFFFDGAVAV